MNSDERNKNLRKMFRSLPEKKAKSDFEARLFQRIRALEEPVYEKKTEPGFFSKFFRPVFIPALGVSLVIMIGLIVYLSMYSSKDDVEQLSLNENSRHEFVIYRPKSSNETRFDLNKEIASLETSERKNLNSSDMSPETKQPSDFFAPPKSIDDGVLKNEMKDEKDVKDARKKSETKEPSPSRDKDIYEREDEPFNILKSDEKSRTEEEKIIIDKNLGRSVVSDSVKAKSKKDSTKKSDKIEGEKDDTLKK